MKGRPPKSTAQHKAQGTYQKVRHANRLEVSTVSEIPTAPAGYSKEKAEMWHRICTDLVEHNILSRADLNALTLYVDSIFIARAALATLEKEGYYIEFAGGNKRLHPAHRVYMDATKQERALYDQFGQTPLARTRLKVEKEDKPEVDHLAEIWASNIQPDKRAKA